MDPAPGARTVAVVQAHGMMVLVRVSLHHFRQKMLDLAAPSLGRIRFVLIVPFDTDHHMVMVADLFAQGYIPSAVHLDARMGRLRVLAVRHKPWVGYLAEGAAEALQTFSQCLSMGLLMPMNVVRDMKVRRIDALLVSHTLQVMLHH